MTNFSSSMLPDPPQSYDAAYFMKLIRQLRNALSRIQSPGPLTCTSDLSQEKVPFPVSALTLVDLPTSATGLPPNSVWNDGGTLKITS